MFPDHTAAHDRPPDPITDELRQELAEVASVARSSLAWLADRKRDRRVVDAEELAEYRRALYDSLDEATGIVRAIMNSSSVCPLCTPCSVVPTAPRRGPQARPEPRWRPRWTRSKP